MKYDILFLELDETSPNSSDFILVSFYIDTSSKSILLVETVCVDISVLRECILQSLYLDSDILMGNLFK